MVTNTGCISESIVQLQFRKTTIRDRRNRFEMNRKLRIALLGYYNDVDDVQNANLNPVHSNGVVCLLNTGRYPCCGQRAFRFEPVKNPFVSNAFKPKPIGNHEIVRKTLIVSKWSDRLKVLNTYGKLIHSRLNN